MNGNVGNAPTDQFGRMALGGGPPRQVTPHFAVAMLLMPMPHLLCCPCAQGGGFPPMAGGMPGGGMGPPSGMRPPGPMLGGGMGPPPPASSGGMPLSSARVQFP